jgi:hypothetical protein
MRPYHLNNLHFQTPNASPVVGTNTAATSQALTPAKPSFETNRNNDLPERPMPTPTSLTADPQSIIDINVPLFNSDFVAPPGQSNAVQRILKSALGGQSNVTAFENKLEARLGGYLGDYIVSLDNIQQPDGGHANIIGTAKMQNLEGQTCNNLT